MKLTAFVLAPITLTMSIAAQTPSYNTVKTFNDKPASQGTDPITGYQRPLNKSRPTGYNTPAGVPQGTRIWMHVPQLRFQGGHQGSDYLTITGMTQDIIPGAAVTVYPHSGHQFATGLAPVASTTATHGFEHAPTGSDIVNFPGAPLVFPLQTFVYAHSFTLTTPVKIQKTELVLFVEFAGGEALDSTTNGQIIASDWWGRGINAGTNYAGIAEGTPYGYVPYAPAHLPKIGMIIDEPVFTATGDHANNYKGGRPTEDMLSINAIAPDFVTPHSRNTSGATLFFNFQGGQRFANGQAVVWTDFGPTSFPLSIGTFAGNLLLNPSNPNLVLVASNTYLLDSAGNYDQGPNGNELLVPLLPPTVVGMVLKFQGVLVSPSFTDIALSNASGMKILP